MSRSLAKTIKPGSEARSVENHTGVSYKPTERTRIRAIEPISFKEALSIADEHGKKHLMLGNGFSIALRPAIFTYNTLYERAKDSKKLSAEMQDVFDKLGTTDFELVMEALENAAILVSLYEKSNPRLAKTLKKEAAHLRDVLAETIAENHPSRPHDITPEQYASCKRFLANFDGQIYTLNYDLLLYWTLMQSEVEPRVKSDDGFRNPEGREEEFVTWDVQNTNEQRIFYLHGALHIYDAGADLLKFTWSKTSVALIDQIKSSLAKREYPLIVTEGTSDQKKTRIQHSNFLGRAYRSFSAITGSLFIYGHSLADNDEHLLKLIDKGKVTKVFVGIYGEPTSERNLAIIDRARKFQTRRRSGSPPDVYFFDASSAHVWDAQDFGTVEKKGKNSAN
ncbi:DUF4917 family protein [Telmatocola sphagniphila]|uniref:DUF4917 family protein n=1 Tax=Telmatocola sphagniphila TaxID=1123043 RepID=A0A8E6ETM5_9BACT|nr:DUF4917 family protein [Telmatocola sphagniphila]QVL30295.1 DUF4917 family protein [Telmatocola sphagniphila]